VIAALALLVVLAPRPATADVSLVLRDGRVTLSARNAPVRQVLAEWARQGRTRIVNLERVVGAPLTLELTDMPEQKALAILLRSVAGYIAAPRPVADPSASVYDRILILPTSVASAAAVTPPPAHIATPLPPFNVPDPTELANGEDDDTPATSERTPADPQQRQPPVFVPPAAEPATPADRDVPAEEAPANPGVLPAPGITPGTAPGQFTTPAPGVLPPPPPPPQPRQ
jgi:hypothetical protein